eukprot:Skav212541  [mRNA]  locus=scaffold1851:448618:450769:+ [translate_table: standard]
MIRHKSALNVARLWTKYVGLGPADRFAQVASMSWDVHVIEVYGTMAAMATSVTCPDLVKKTSLPHLRLLDVGGEALGSDVVDTWAPGRKLFNSSLVAALRLEPVVPLQLRLVHWG